jgi:4-hydroxybenzoate polyprenyltransferase
MSKASVQVKLVGSNHSMPLSILRMCLAETRPSVLGIFLLRYLCGVVLARNYTDPRIVPRVLVAAVIWELAVVFVYLFNGITDLAEDRVNGSLRPIARGDLPPKVASWVSVSAATAALAGGILLGGQFRWLVPVLLALGFLYSGPPCYLKRRTATAVISGILGGWLTYCAGSAAAGRGILAGASLIFVVAQSAWMGLVGSMTKDLPDVPGDIAARRLTAVAVHGEKVVRVVASITALGLGAAFVVAAAYTAGVLLLPAVAMLVGALFVARAAQRSRPVGSRKDRRRPYRAFMMTQYATHGCLLAAIALEHSFH